MPLANPLRVAENTAFVDILSNGRFALGLGSGYRKYEFDGFGVDFDTRRDIQEEALPLLLDLLHHKRVEHHGAHFRFNVGGQYELFPHALQVPHPPIFLAGATARSIGVAARMGLGLFLSSWTPFAELARQSASYRALLAETPQALRANPARGHVDVARWVYVAETDAKAKRDSEHGIMRNLAHFGSGHTSGYLGTVSQDVGAAPRDYDSLARDIILHGSPATVIAKIEELQSIAHNASIMLHFPPWYGAEKALASPRIVRRRGYAEIPPNAQGAKERVTIRREVYRRDCRSESGNPGAGIRRRDGLTRSRRNNALRMVRKIG